MPNCRLYLITPPVIDPAPFADDLAVALDGGDVACLQLRLKEAGDEEILKAADILAPVARARDVAFVINDRADLAAKVECDGVHVGQEDTPYAQARSLVGKDAIIGVTCHNSRHLAIEAAEAGADYVAFGAFFPTATKEAKASTEVEILQWWSETTTVPSVAIGGITPGNCEPLVRAGTDFLAVVGAVWSTEGGPAAAVKEFNRVIAEAG
ncbi:MAG: thiamine phosphate synthase [Rhodospirillales bacterium]|nr:thiamine phosphate synthase [Rhodospirillales bacterium]